MHRNRAHVPLINIIFHMQVEKLQNIYLHVQPQFGLLSSDRSLSSTETNCVGANFRFNVYMNTSPVSLSLSLDAEP